MLDMIFCRTLEQNELDLILHFDRYLTPNCDLTLGAEQRCSTEKVEFMKEGTLIFVIRGSGHAPNGVGKSG